MIALIERAIVASCCLVVNVACDETRDRSARAKQESHVVAAASASASASPSVPSAASARGAAGCRDNSECRAAEYCAFTPGLCGKGQRLGACSPRPAECAGERVPVCGCDGKVYDNACLARAAGVDLSLRGGCRELVPNWASCGSRYCDVNRSYCEIYLSDVFEIPSDYHCRPLPTACLAEAGGVRACDCFPSDTPCRSFCGTIVTGGKSGFHLTCQGKRPPREP